MVDEYEVKRFDEAQMSHQFENYVLGVDIGGTHVNIGVAGVAERKPVLLFSLNFSSGKLSSLSSAINETLRYAFSNHNIILHHACIGAAGVVSPSQDYAELTNVPWNIHVKEIIEETGLTNVFILNDFQTIGYGINLLNEDDFVEIKPGGEQNLRHRTKAVIGAGTGLGKTILVYDDHSQVSRPLPSEGGHSDFPPQNEFELALTSFIKNMRKISKPLCYEEVLSGRGIENIYFFLRKHGQYSETRYSREIETSQEKAPLISKYSSVDETCAETLRLFTRFYGRCAKNFVLDTLATGGLYIAGGIAAKNHEIFTTTKDFLEEFTSADQRENILQQTPVYIILNYDVSLYGACLAAVHQYF